VKKRIKINGFIIFFCVILVAVFHKQFLRLDEAEGDILVQILGMFIMLFGMLFRVSSRGFKSEYSVGGKTLVTGGPYSIVRNPMYLGISCIALGLILLMFQWWVFLVFLVIFALRYITLIFKEEKLLKNNFGQQYSEYQKAVPRLLPRLKAVFTGKLFKALSIKGSWLKKEANGIVPLLIIVFGFAIWKGVANFMILAAVALVFTLFLRNNYGKSSN